MMNVASTRAVRALFFHVMFVALLASHRDALAQVPTKQLKRRPPVRTRLAPVRGEAKVPSDVELGFAADVDGILQHRDWQVSGTVTELQDGMVLFRTDSGKKGRLAYRIPGGLKPALAVGQPITVVHDLVAGGKRFAYDLHISSGETLILATSHNHRDRPPQSVASAEQIFTGQREGEETRHALSFWSNSNHHERQSDSNQHTHYHAPISIVHNGSTVADQIGELEQATITLDGSEYIFLVTNSSHVELKGEAKEEYGQDSNHSLEYVLMKKTG